MRLTDGLRSVVTRLGREPGQNAPLASVPSLAEPFWPAVQSGMTKVQSLAILDSRAQEHRPTRNAGAGAG